MSTSRSKLFASPEVVSLRNKLRVGRTSGSEADKAAEQTMPKQQGISEYLPEEGIIFFDPSKDKFANPRMNGTFTVLAVAVKPNGETYPFEFYLNSIVKSIALCDKEGKYVDESGAPSPTKVFVSTTGTLVQRYLNCASTTEVYELLCSLEKGVKVTSKKVMGLSHNFRTDTDSPKEQRLYNYDVL